MLVHLHDSYAMHSIFSPGFPGLLESIYVQERVMERMMPDVYASFVSAWRVPCARARVLLLKDGHTEETHDLLDIVHNKVVHYPFCQHDPVPDAITAMGCVLPRGS